VKDRTNVVNMPTVCPVQLDFRTNDIVGNANKIIDYVSSVDADIFLCPELALNGGMHDGIDFNAHYDYQLKHAIYTICEKIKDKVIVIGYAEQGKYAATSWFNKVVWIENGVVQHDWHNPHASYLSQVAEDLPLLKIIEWRGFSVAVTSIDSLDLISLDESCDFILILAAKLFVAQDLSGVSHQNPINEFARYNSFVLDDKLNDWQQSIAAFVKYYKIPAAAANMAGMFGNRLFNGESCAFNANGNVIHWIPSFHSAANLDAKWQVNDWQQSPILRTLVDSKYPGFTHKDAADIYNALVFAVKSYVEEYSFAGVLLGLSGGIDSALTLAIAVDAITKDKVSAVMLPYLYTSDASKRDAKLQAVNFGVDFHEIAINDSVRSVFTTLGNVFSGFDQQDTTSENIQARVRAVILMAIANKKDLLLLNTGNKSELATGYCTLYGDMAGGFAPLKDVLKTQVYRLAKYRNALSVWEGTAWKKRDAVIPESVIVRAPSAELAPNQIDEDTLPPYPELDYILMHLFRLESINPNFTVQDLIDACSDVSVDTVTKVIDLFYGSAFKRQQAAPGPVIS